MSAAVWGNLSLLLT
uniref:Uncharacterized protein n=1 Tax=Arundo donax TaxID=35708 RepID=A0A0A9EYX1_ARUDO